MAVSRFGTLYIVLLPFIGEVARDWDMRTVI